MAITTASEAAAFDHATISGLGIRNIGSSAMSGRVSAIAAYNEDGKTVIYVGAASGGVWKSLDGGTTFAPKFDDQPVQSIGAIALDPSNPKNVWVGTGESWTRNSVSVGNGVYRSTDGGETWSHLGLPESERIAKIVVHPKDGNIAWVCAPGKLWSDSDERGLFKTRDAGRTWTKVLAGPNRSTGCSDLELDPQNPDGVLAAMWDFRRQGWTFRSGGGSETAASGSGLFRSQDGGAHWTEYTPAANPGFPAKPYGRIGIAIAPSDPKIVYAVVEGTRSALFRSNDGGATWEERDRSQMMVWRPFYFSNLIVDPTNPDRVFKTNLGLIASEDGGKSFSGAGGGAHGDWHDLWIDPARPKHLVGGDDGGLWTSTNGGSLWHKNENLPISQFYHVAVDDQDPYEVYGGLQDNTSWIAPSSYPGGITNAQWEPFAGGDGFWMFPDPIAPKDYVYFESQGGSIVRANRHTLQQRDIQPKANYKEKLRFNWNAPIHLSPTERGTIYLGSQFLHRSRDQGQSWERISPDLTSNDPAKQQQEKSGGITVDNSAAEMHTTIYSISASPQDGGVIWVGTDDGNVQLTRDGGKTWNNTVGNIRGLPKASWVSWVEASRFDAATAYAAFDRHTFGDMDPHVYVTRDFGRSWTRIADKAQGVRGYAHVIKEDVVDRDLLFLGTEFGLWVSIDGGAHWAAFKGGKFPSVAVRDLAIQPRDHDLVLATHGRGLWIIDDITPLRHLDAAALDAELTLLPDRPQQQRLQGYGGWSRGDAVFVGANAPGGAVITYHQKTRHLFGKLTLEILDAAGKVVDTLPASKRRGINRVEWAMTVKPPRTPQGATLAGAATYGPRVLPGRYTVRLTKNGQVHEAPLEIGMDPRATYTLDERKAQFDAAMRVHGLFERMADLSDRIVGLREQAKAKAAALPDGDRTKVKLATLVNRIEDVRRQIVATKEGGAITGEERLREHMDALYAAIVNWEGRPGAYHLARTDALERELGEVEASFTALIDREAKTLGLDPAVRAVASGLGSPRAAMHALRYYWQTPDLISTLREKKRR
ncbi:MAG: sialidase [Rhodanobacteraceae bacterium]|nr:sialidase [Rhodanobacteraceae bacterium]MBL0039822.1 sialidase [Xanthomonadales bacterium]